jgi:simple sugar transport system permease protein
MEARLAQRRRGSRVGAKARLNRLLLSLIAPALALVFAGVITSIVLLSTGHNPGNALSKMVDYGTQAGSEVSILNAATAYYLSAIAVAIGFRMNLFNIGVDGQYRIAAMFAAAFGGAVALPAGIHQIAIILVAMITGALWAGIKAVLKVTRGVSEVISSIMLNFIATGFIAFMMQKYIFGQQAAGSQDITTKPISSSGQVGGLDLISGAGTKVYGLIFLAIGVGIAFQFIITRTRFGFDLRAAGRSGTAASASGVNVKRMTITAMLLSGAVAGLVGMPALLGSSHSYSSITFQSGLGFTGIAVALIGRNHPVGIAFGALLWAFLDQSSLVLDLNGIPKEIVQVTQAVAVLSVVVAYELVRRVNLRREQRRVGRAVAAPPLPPDGSARIEPVGVTA